MKTVIEKLIDRIWCMLMVNKKEIKKNRICSFLFILPFGIGNTILAIGAMQSIRKAFPDCKISGVYLQEPTEEILKILGYFESYFFWNINSDKKQIKRFRDWLKQKKFDVSITFFPNLERKIRWYIMRSGIPTRIGFLPPAEFSNTMPALFLTHCIEYNKEGSEFKNNLMLLDPLNIELINTCSFAVKEFSFPFLQLKKLKIGLHKGRKNNRKPGWPIENFVDVAKKLIERYNAQVFIFGGKEEISDTEFFNNSLPASNTTVLIGKLSLEETTFCISQMDILITNDSGLMHIAASQNRPLVAIFGPTDIIKSRPIFQDPEKCVIIKKEYPCNPCYPQNVLIACKGKAPCLMDITSGEILAHVAKLLSKI